MTEFNTGHFVKASVRKLSSISIELVLCSSPDAQDQLFLFLFEERKLNKLIHKVNGQMGSGKSREVLRWYFNLVKESAGKGVPATIAVPTNGLADQYEKYLTAMEIPFVVINQDRGFRSSSEEYRRLCKEGFSGVLIVAHVVALTETEYAKDRLLIVDEAISPLDTIKIGFRKPEELDEIAVKLTADVPGFYELVADEITSQVLDDRADVQSFYMTHGKKAQDLAEYTSCDHFRVVIDIESFDSAKSGDSFEDHETVILQFTIFMLSTIANEYKNVLMISADFDDIMVSLMWSKSVAFQSHSEIENRLDYLDFHHKSNLVELYHAPIKNLSGTFLKSLDKEKRREEVGTQIFADMFATAIGEVFPDTPHIFCLNKHPKKDSKYRWLLEGENGGERLFTVPHGRNDLDHYKMAVFGAAINLDPITEHRLFAFYGITKKQIKKAIAYLTVAQFCGRTAVRKWKGTDKVIFVLPDEGTADFMRELFNCAPSTPLPMSLEQAKRGRPVKANKVPPKPRKPKKTDEQKREDARLRQQKSRAKKLGTEIRV